LLNWLALRNGVEARVVDLSRSGSPRGRDNLSRFNRDLHVSGNSRNLRKFGDLVRILDLFGRDRLLERRESLDVNRSGEFADNFLFNFCSLGERNLSLGDQFPELI